MDSLRTQTLHSLNWTLAAQILREFLRFAISVILARMLEPTAFGQIAMVCVITGFAQMFTNMGLDDALIQHRNPSRHHFSAVFWTSLSAGILMSCLIALLSPGIAAFYRSPSLQPLVMFMSIEFTVSALQIVPGATLRREMKFKQLAIVETSAVMIAGTLAIITALRGFGVWSLVVYSMGTSALTAAFAWFAAGGQSLSSFHFSALRGMLHFGLNLMGFNVLNYFSRQLDNLLIGRHLGALELGFYSRAYNLMLLPVTQINQVATRVIFSALCRIQDDRERVARAYLRSIQYISFVTFPVMLGMCVVAHPFILVVFGDKWLPMTPLLRLLSLVGLNQSISTTCGWLFRSQGRTDLLFRWSLVSSVVICTSFFVGIRWGTLGVAIAYAVCVYGILWYPFWRLAGGLVGLRFSDMIRAISGNAAAAVVMATVVYTVQLFVPPHRFSPAVRLAALVVLGTGVYMLMVHVTGNRTYVEVRQNLAKRFRRP